MTYVPPPPGGDIPPGQVPPYGASVAKPRDNAQVYGIIGIITAFVCCSPLGILFGWMSMTEARKVGKDDTLGKVAFWAGIVMTAIALLGGLSAVCFGGFGAFAREN
jgi:hypothetical protein